MMVGFLKESEEKSEWAKEPHNANVIDRQTS